LDTSIPYMILCPGALKHGNIVFPLQWTGIPPPMVCDDQPKNDFQSAPTGLGERTTWRMANLGSTILHEYTYVKPKRFVEIEP
jgi:hypothetical protein